jgi:hypothetical protein
VGHSLASRFEAISTDGLTMGKRLIQWFAEISVKGVPS